MRRGKIGFGCSSISHLLSTAKGTFRTTFGIERMRVGWLDCGLLGMEWGRL